jgi:hypothetical protein
MCNEFDLTKHVASGVGRSCTRMCTVVCVGAGIFVCFVCVCMCVRARTGVCVFGRLLIDFIIISSYPVQLIHVMCSVCFNLQYARRVPHFVFLIL